MATASKPGGGLIRAIAGRQDLLLVGVIIVMTAIFSAINPVFFSLSVTANILQDWAPIMLLGIGQTYVIITGGIDLSVGSTLGLSGIVAAKVIRSMTENDMPTAVTILLGVLVAVLVGAVIGAINALLVLKVKLVPFVATLATMGAAAGLTLVISNGVQIGGGPRAVITIGTTRYLEIFTLPLIVTIIILAITWVVLARTQFGRWTYAIGSNSFASRGAGIDVTRHLAKIYVLSGITAGLAGLFVYFRLGSGSPTSGRGSELSAIAAVVIGGTSLFGGRGRMSGTALGALITTGVLSGLILIGVQPNWQQVVVGVLIAIAVAVQQLNLTGRSTS